MNKVQTPEYENEPYHPPSLALDELYDQLAYRKCLEIPRVFLKYVHILCICIYTLTTFLVGNVADICCNCMMIFFRKSELLGGGEFGEVFKGSWTTPFGIQEVAIKMLKQGTSHDTRIKFLQEAAIMGQFFHPHIVRLYGAVTLNEPVCLHHIVCMTDAVLYDV